MKQNIFIGIIILILFTACDEPVFEKPENLIGEKQMIDMLVDVHLAESTFIRSSPRDSLIRNYSSDVFYYSVLEKYQVPDSLFEKSFVYYASSPKKFEKMYRNVMNKLNEMEQEFSERENNPLEFERRKR